MCDNNEQEITSRRVAQVAGHVARVLQTSHTTKQHGGFDHYKDDHIHISLDTYVPNVDIRVKVEDGWRYVYSVAHHSIDHPTVFRRGKWLDYLFGELHERAEQRQAAIDADREMRRQAHRHKHFSPIDDSASFGDGDA